MADTRIMGYLLKMERLRQNKGQKEICYGICVPSYLSKIEHGTVEPATEILQQLYERLGIHIESDPLVLDRIKNKIERYYSDLQYYFENSIYEELCEEREFLDYSMYTIDWLIIQALEGEDTLEQLKQCEDFMTKQQKGYFAMILASFWQTSIGKNKEKEKLKREKMIEESRRGYELLGTAYAYNQVIYSYYLLGEYAKVHQMESTLVNLAVKEGNTCALADYYVLNGSAYACLNMDEMMMTCYTRAMNLLKNTRWEKLLQEIYYNIGATYISLKKYEDAMMYLNKIENPKFLTNHKKGIIMIRTGKIEEGKRFLKKAEEYTLENSDRLRLREAYMECEKDYLSNPMYLQLLEELLKALEQERHFGHIYFYKDVLLAAYKSQRKYKKMVEIMELFEEKRM